MRLVAQAQFGGKYDEGLIIPIINETTRVPLQRIEQISRNAVRYTVAPIANVNDRATFV